MPQYRLKTPRAIEKALVGTYKRIERAVTGAYRKIEGGFVRAFLERTDAPDDKTDK